MSFCNMSHCFLCERPINSMHYFHSHDETLKKGWETDYMISDHSSSSSLCNSTCWLSSMISASLPPFLDKDGFFLMAGVLCWTRCGVGMFLGTVGDVLCGPGLVRDGERCWAFECTQNLCIYFGLVATVAMDVAHYRELILSACIFDMAFLWMDFK